MRVEVQEKTKELKTALATLVRKHKSLFGKWVPGRAARIQETKVALELLAALDKELGERTAPGGSVTYQRVLQLTSAVTSALGYGGTENLSLSERILLASDRHLQGFKDVPITEYYERFKSNTFVIFEKTSPVRGFKEVEKSFVDAVYNLNELELIGLPITRDIDVDILFRLLPFGIFPLGVTRPPVAADGFVRPSVDFLLHDERHSTSIFGKRKLYEQAHGLTREGSAKLSKLMDVWGSDLLDRIRALPKGEFRSAVIMLAFNHHHDRGMPLVPSSYVTPEIDHVPKLLYMMLRVSGQRKGFANHKKTLAEAHTWLREFFLPKLREEQALWAKKA